MGSSGYGHGSLQMSLGLWTRNMKYRDETKALLRADAW